MTCQEKKAWLSRYRWLVQRENHLREEMEQWRARAEGATLGSAGEGMPSAAGDGTAPFVRPLEHVSLLEQKLAAQLDAAASLRSEIGAAIAGVEDEKLRCVLELRYIHGFTWEKCAVEMNYDYRHICRLHGKALQEVKIEKMS